MSVTMITFCLGFCQILLFVRVLSDRFPVYSVTSCPQNDIEWRKSSERLNCSLHYNKKLYRYHCLPDSKLTTLVEFCYDHIRPLVPKGNCVVLNTHSTLLDTYNCSKFKDGCPDVHFDSDAILKYPSCLLIETKKQCYLAENTCITVPGSNLTTQSILSGPSTARREGQEIHDICLAAIIIAIIVVLLTPGVICFILWIKGSRRKSLSEEERPLTDILDFEDTSLRIQTVLLGEAVCMRSTVVSLEKATAFIGDNVNLKWTYKSPQMKQFKDISEDPERVTCCTTLPNPKLMIRRAYKRDEGEYKLTLNENKEEIFKLEVLGFKPKVNVIGGNFVYKGETASFVVMQSSYPEASCIRWYKVEKEHGTNKVINKKIIDLSLEKYKGSTFDFFVINDANDEDRGYYKVVVENILGEGCKEIHLIVKDEDTQELSKDTAQEIGNENLRKNTRKTNEAAAKENQSSTLLIEEGKKDLISISKVRRVYHISDAGKGNFWISDGGRLMKVDQYGYLIQLEEVGWFNTGCHSVTSKGEIIYLKEEHILKCSSSREINLFAKPKDQDTLKWVAWCIYCSAYKNDILVGLHEEDTGTGKIQRYAEDNYTLKESFGESIFCKPLYMTENKDGEVIVSDAGKRAVVAVKEGRKIFQYERESPWKIFPTGLCTDESNCILVCIYENNESNIHLLSKSGIFLKKLLRKEDCAFGPCAICIVGKHLYLGQESCQDIQVYEIKRDSKD